MVYNLIRLFPPDATDFKTNGLGSLSEAISCVVKEELNNTYELEMSYPIWGKRYNDLTNRSIIVCAPNPNDDPQAFRVYKIDKPMNGQCTYYAAHIKYDLSGYPVDSFEADSCAAVISGMKTHSLVEHPFEFWTDVEQEGYYWIPYPVSILAALGSSDGCVMQLYKGDFKFDNFQVRFQSKRGQDNNVTIRYGKNLTDVSQEEDSSNVYSGILPYCYYEKDGYQILEVLPDNNGIIDVNPGLGYTNIYLLDLSGEFPEGSTEGELRQKTTEYVKANNVLNPNINLTVSFIQLEQSKEYETITQLEKVELGDTIHVVHPELNVKASLRVITTEYDVLTGRYNSITLGDPKSDIADTMSGIQSSIQSTADQSYYRAKSDMDAMKSELQKEVDSATDWITNGKGYIVGVKDAGGRWIELLCMDTPDVNTARKVWRWNNGGLGYSSNGYNGPYTTAITQDGSIVADFITTGQLTANIIKAGILQSKDGESFVLDLVANTLKMKNGVITAGSISGATVTGTAISGGTIDGSVFTSTNTTNHNSMKIEGANLTLSGGLLGRFTITAANRDYSDDYQNPDFESISSAAAVLSMEALYSDGSWNVGAFIMETGHSRVFTIVQPSGGPSSLYSTPFIYFECNLTQRNMSYAHFGITDFYDVDVSNAISEISLTQNYGEKSSYAVTSTSPLILDIGEGQTDENGECYVSIDDIFSEIGATNITYQVFLQKEGPGDLWVAEKTSRYFLVKGTENLNFSWELKAKQQGYEIYRLENKRDIDEISAINTESMLVYELEEIIKETEGNYYETAN